MKKFYILLVAMIVLLLSSCQRSQFSTTTRQNKNGKVTYVNHYPTERTKSSTVRSHKSHLKEAEAQKNLSALDKTGVQDIPEPEIKKITPVLISHNENLIASTSNELNIIDVNESRVVSNNDLILSLKKHYGCKIGNSLPDTIKSNVPIKGTANDSITSKVIIFKNGNEKTVRIIKFKNGHKKAVRIINQSHDTLFYKLITEPNVVIGITMDQIDTILPDTRKTEKLGLAGFILSILGFIPGIGIPIAIIGVILGVQSLHRIKRFPEKYKGKEFGQASLIIWISAIILSFIFVGILILIT